MKKMKIHKRVVRQLERVYSLAMVPGFNSGGLPGFVAGSEGDEGLLLFEPPGYDGKVIAHQPGGFISLVGLQKDSRPYVLASVDFKPGFKAENCRILLYPLDQGECPEPYEVARLPFAHRIAITEVDRELCFLASTLCSAKQFKDDWSHPGGIYLSFIPANLNQAWSLRQLVDSLSKSHGMDYARLERGSKGGFLISAMEGLFHLRIPERKGSEWPFERIADGEHSDAFAYDLNASGTADIFTLSPFHGNTLSMYRKLSGGWKRTVIDDDIEMGHIVWAGEFLGEPGIIAGGRRGRKELRLYRLLDAEKNQFRKEIIDEGIGATQMLVINRASDSALLIVAGHGTNEVLIYDIHK